MSFINAISDVESKIGSNNYTLQIITMYYSVILVAALYLLRVTLLDLKSLVFKAVDGV